MLCLLSLFLLSYINLNAQVEIAKQRNFISGDLIVQLTSNGKIRTLINKAPIHFKLEI